MIKRVKRLWALSQKDHTKVDALLDAHVEVLPVEGDGKAEFLGEGTQEEFVEYENERKGLKKVFDFFKV